MASDPTVQSTPPVAPNPDQSSDDPLAISDPSKDPNLPQPPTPQDLANLPPIPNNTLLSPGIDDAYSPDAGPIGAYEMEAQALNQQTIAQYGTYANPQTLLDLLKTGASTPALQAIASGDPEYASLLSSAPSGMAPRLNTQSDAAAGLNLSNDPNLKSLYSFGETDMARVQQFAGHSSDNDIRQLGEEAPMNVGYVSQLKLSKDSNRISNWQIFLKSKGELLNKFQVNGKWDSDTNAAFTSYMVAKYLPEALYGKNQAKSKMFLNQMGVTLDGTNGLISQLGRNGLQKEAFLKWLQTQDSQHAREALSVYIQQYGQNAVPTSFQNLTGSWMDTFQDTLSGVPVLGSIFSPVENLFNLNKLNTPGDLFKNNRDVREEFATRTLSPTDKDAVAAITQEAQHSVGWFGALDAWDRARTRTLLGIFWDFSDNGLDFGKWHNPLDNAANNFDASTAYGRRIAVGQNDLLGNSPVVAGWFNQNEALKGIANFGANLLDDPLSYTGVGFVGHGAISGLKALHDFAEVSEIGGRVISATDKVWVPFSAKDWIIGDRLRSSMDQTLSLQGQWQARRALASDIKAQSKDDVRSTFNLMQGMSSQDLMLGGKSRALDLYRRKALDAIVVNERNVRSLNEMADVVAHPFVSQHDIAMLLHADAESPHVMQAVQEIQKAARKGDKNATIKAILKSFDHDMQDASFAHNYYEALQGITPVMTKRMSLGKIQRILTHGSQGLVSPVVDFEKPLLVMDYMTKQAHAVGMYLTTLRPFIKKIEETNDVDQRGNIFTDFQNEIAGMYEKHPELSQISFNGKTGLEALAEWKKGTRLNQGDINSTEDVTSGPGTMFAPEEIKNDQGKGTGEFRERSTSAPKSGGLRAVREAIRTNAVIQEKLAQIVGTLQQAAPWTVQEWDALGPEAVNTTRDATKLLDAYKAKMATQPEMAGRTANMVSGIQYHLAALRTYEAELDKKAPEGKSVAAPAFTSQLRYKGVAFATPQELIAFNHPSLRHMESFQAKIKADTVRSMWAQMEIARVSSAFRIVIGDEISRFFFSLIANGHGLLAMKYATQMGLGPLLKAGRALGMTEKGMHQVDPRLGTSAMSLAGASNAIGHSLLTPGSHLYNKGLARSIFHIFGKDHFSREWMEHTAKHIDISDELMNAEKKWFTDHAGAQDHVANSLRMMEERGLMDHAKRLSEMQKKLEEQITEGGQRAIVKDSSGKEYFPQFAPINLDRLGGVFREGKGDAQLTKKLNQVTKFRQDNDVAKLRQMMIDKDIDPALLTHLDERHTEAAQRIGLQGDRFDTHDLRESLGNYRNELAQRMIHRQVMLTNRSVKEYEELAKKLRENPAEAMKLWAWEDWKDELGSTTSHEEMAKMIEDFLGRNNNSKTINALERFRQNMTLTDLVDNPNSPMAVKSGNELGATHQAIVHAIRSVLNDPTHNEEDLVTLNQHLRGIDPSIGEWRKDLSKQAEKQLTESRSMVSLLSKDSRYFGYMSAGEWSKRQAAILADNYNHPLMKKWVKHTTGLKYDAETEAERRVQEAEAERAFARDFQPELNEVMRRNSLNHDNLGLPVIVQPLTTHENLRGLQKGAQKYFDYMHEHVTGAMVNYARQVGMETIMEQKFQALRQAHPEWFDAAGKPMAEAQWRAHSYAMAWVQRNTYQGQRTVMGGVLRNAFPFWGATANMSKFWMRQISQHKHYQAPFFHTLDVIDQTQANGGVHLELPFTNFFMSKVTGNQGEDISVDPLKPFFFTSDGIGGFLPGMGPYLSLPLDMAANVDPNLVNSTMQAFGPAGDIWKQHINTNAVNPLLSWTPGILGGAYEAMTGHETPAIPFVTSSNSQEDQSILAMTREKQATRDDQGLGAPEDPQGQVTEATKSVGSAHLVDGLFNFLFPIGVKSGDQRANSIKEQTKKWDEATASKQTAMLAASFNTSTTAMSAAIQTGDVVHWVAHNPQNPANLLLYFSKSVSEDDKRSISFYAPWVVDYATSKYDPTKQVDAPKIYSNAQEFGQQVDTGKVHTLDPATYVANINKNRQYNQAWAMYALLKQKEYAWMQQTGNSSQSAAAKAYRAAFFDPQFQALTNYYPDWANQFAQQSRKDVLGLMVSTRPIRSLMTWEVIPQFGEFETKKTQLWRQVVVDKENAAEAIRSIRLSGGSRQDQEAVLTGFQQRLLQYAAMDRTFAGELDGFHYGRIEDLINLESMGNASSG